MDDRKEQYTILVVSPYLEKSDLLDVLQRDPHYRVMRFMHQNEVKETLAHDSVDLILLEDGLPGLHILDVVIQARGIDPDTQIIAVATDKSHCIEEHLWRGGIDDVICQPITHVQINYRVARALKMRRLCVSNLDLTKENRQLFKLTVTDGLTKLHNRRHFTERFQAEFTRIQRFGGSLGCMIGDIDNFHVINDNYGHLAGDQILSELSRIFRRTLRRIDLIGRYGGEEFATMLPETVGDGLALVAERLRKMIEIYDFRTVITDALPSEKVSITMSFGIASFPDLRITTSDELLNLADEALYRAKECGRNRIEAA